MRLTAIGRSADWNTCRTQRSDSPLPSIAFRLVIRASSRSPGNTGLRDALLGSLAEAGLPHENNTDRQYEPLVSGDHRVLVIESITPARAEFEMAALNAALCTAMFATMTKTQAFIPPSDDQSRTIIPWGRPADRRAATKPSTSRWSLRRASCAQIFVRLSIAGPPLIRLDRQSGQPDPRRHGVAPGARPPAGWGAIRSAWRSRCAAQNHPRHELATGEVSACWA